jgi:ribose transport system substrate-binding protein
MNKGAQAAGKALGATVTWQGPSVYGAQAQIQILDAVKSGHPSALLVAPDDVKALIGTLKDFKSAGVPVITVDTDVYDTSVRLGNITSDNVLGGQLAEQYLAKRIPAGSKVVYVGEPPGISTTDQREQGFVKAVKSSSFKDLTPQFGTDDDPNTATTLVSALIQRNPDLKGIFASDTAWGQGAATAVQNAGKSGQIQIVAFDAEPEEVQDLARGTIQALIVQKAYLEGYDAVSYAVNYIRHHTAVPAETHPSYVVATKANISSPDVQKYVYAQK